jgi:hypothetical protein
MATSPTKKSKPMEDKYTVVISDCAYQSEDFAYARTILCPFWTQTDDSEPVLLTENNELKTVTVFEIFKRFRSYHMFRNVRSEKESGDDDRVIRVSTEIEDEIDCSLQRFLALGGVTKHEQHDLAQHGAVMEIMNGVYTYLVFAYMNRSEVLPQVLHKVVQFQEMQKLIAKLGKCRAPLTLSEWLSDQSTFDKIF